MLRIDAIRRGDSVNMGRAGKNFTLVAKVCALGVIANQRWHSGDAGC